jgi:phage terminase, small subunit|nr:MAG TPA: Terminase small subunit [Caudoviricetes sp.]DAW41474.1 MAG TPA: Terminase small subunit [Caudoviricetes sp.]
MLNEKQKRFVSEYIIDLNAKQAAIRAGYSPKGAEPQASRLLSNAKIQVEIAKAMEDRGKRTGITQDRVLAELSAIAFAKATDYVEVDDDGSVKIKPTAELTDEQKKAIASIKEGANGIEIKLTDKTKALEMLSRHLGLFNDKLNVNVEAIEIIEDIGDLESDGD